MNTLNNISALTFILLVTFSTCSSAASPNGQNNFLKCLFQNSSNISDVVYTPGNSSFTSVYRFRIWNLRYLTESYRKPQVIITPEYESQVPPIILCAKKNKLEIRTRSGGHDFEGTSSTSEVPFVIIDLILLSNITVDVEAKTAWVEGGANLGSVYYRIAEKSSTLGFPAGLCPLVGVGGHISGGGYGPMFRKYGLAGDHVLDARIVDVNGRILDRESMGEDLFWAIRGGGAASFGVVVAWKLELVDVPEKLTVFNIGRTLEQNATQLIHRWQYVAPKIDRDLYMGLNAARVNSTTISAAFFSVLQGGIDRLLALMETEFPELGIVREDCTEVSWIQSVLLMTGAYSISAPPEVLLNRTQPAARFLKIKTDYVQKPMPLSVFDEIMTRYQQPEGELAQLYFVPYGGRMDEISASATPFPHRKGNLYMVAYFVDWREEDDQDSERYVNWDRRIYNFVTPYVSSSPRSAYINYKDLDNGVNNKNGKTSYAQASIWGKRYFKKNFDRLVEVKTIVDPKNFFKHEQSIPPMQLKMGKQGSLSDNLDE
ncbi:hypothetical protein ACS0TY_018683 [Phlomoides rotata]